MNQTLIGWAEDLSIDFVNWYVFVKVISYLAKLSLCFQAGSKEHPLRIDPRNNSQLIQQILTFYY